MSFGLFIVAVVWVSDSTHWAMARLMDTVSANCCFGSRKVGVSSRLNVRFFPGSLCHTVPFCPLPSCWSTAIITVPSGSGVDFDRASLRYSLVEGIRCNVITFCPSNNPENVLLCNTNGIKGYHCPKTIIIFNDKKQKISPIRPPVGGCCTRNAGEEGK